MEKTMFDEMRESGSNLPDMVEALQHAGWQTKNHHDNWVCANFPHGMDTHSAWNTLSFVEKFKPAQIRFNITMANLPRDANNVLNWPKLYAEAYLKHENIEYRIINTDGVAHVATRDYKPERANLTIVNNIVTKITFG